MERSKNTSNHGFRERLKLAMDGLSNSEVARRAGLSDSAIRNYVTGDSLPVLDKLTSLAAATEVRPEWLAFGQLPMKRGVLERVLPKTHEETLEGLVVTAGTGEALEPRDGYTFIPRRAVTASAGDAVLLPSDEIIDHILFKTEWLRSELRLDPQLVVVIQAKGDSMEPVIEDGDLLLVDLRRSGDRADGVHVINLDGKVLVKRLQHRLDGAIGVLSDNPSYPAELVKLADVDNFHIVGRVVWSGSRM
jgi:phage repressor protein C with HTH and peptisase S24 domain